MKGNNVEKNEGEKQLRKLIKKWGGNKEEKIGQIIPCKKIILNNLHLYINFQIYNLQSKKC